MKLGLIYKSNGRLNTTKRYYRGNIIQFLLMGCQYGPKLKNQLSFVNINRVPKVKLGHVFQLAERFTRKKD